MIKNQHSGPKKLKIPALGKLIDRRVEAGSLRKLVVLPQGADFCSNDYLGFARSKTLFELFLSKLAQKKPANFNFMGSTGSRLISGNTKLVESLEKEIARFHHAKAGLIFNSGYNANLALFSSVAQKNDTIIYDALCHASIREGILLSFAKSYSFRHNDTADLEKKIKTRGRGNVFVAVEALYSMDGDLCPLAELVRICEQYGAHLIVDEAHSGGTLGSRGEGLIASQNMEAHVFARVHTFGKALGCHGAIVLGDAILKTYLINHGKAFIYTTALPFYNLIAIQCAYQHLKNNASLILELHSKVKQFNSHIKESKLEEHFLKSDSPIQGFLIPDNFAMKKAERYLHSHRYNVKAILSPTVPRSRERFRICLHAFNRREDITSLIRCIQKMVHKWKIFS